MTVINICSLVSVLLMVSMLFFIGCYMDRLNNKIQDLADKQFDAEEVMKLFNMKFNRPIVYEDKKQIVELYENIEIPWERYHMIKDNEDFDAYIKRELADMYAERIMTYVDIVADSDYVRNTKVIKARLRVVNK